MQHEQPVLLHLLALCPNDFCNRHVLLFNRPSCLSTLHKCGVCRLNVQAPPPMGLSHDQLLAALDSAALQPYASFMPPLVLPCAPGRPPSGRQVVCSYKCCGSLISVTSCQPCSQDKMCSTLATLFEPWHGTDISTMSQFWLS